MGPYYKFFFEVQFPSGERKAVQYAVAHEVAIPFRPYDLCDDSISAYLTGGLTADKAAICDKERKRLADRIAHDLAAHIMEAIKEKDTANGYEQNPSCLGTGHLVAGTQHNIVGRPNDLTKNGQ